MMPKINRLSGRFFTVLISLSLVFCLPRAAFAGGATGPTLCQISDTVYRADGSPAHGTVLLSWQAFTTSAGQAVSPGSLLVTLDSSGGFNASLAPNTGASPAGTYYKAIFKLDDGTTETEYWVVPNTQTTTIGAIRSKLVPAQQAAQFLTRDVADSVYVSLASTQTITGTKTFSASPAVPTPQNPTDAANKSYVDANSGSGNLASPPPIGNVTPNSVAATSLTAQNVNGVVNAASYPGADWSVATNAAIAAAPSGGKVSLLGFTAAQLAAAGSVTVAANKPIKLVMPPGALVFNGNPGISITANGVHIEGQGSVIASQNLYDVSPTILKSGSASILVQDTAQSGTDIRNVELDGNNVGLIGVYHPYGGEINTVRLRVERFQYQGLYLTSGLPRIHDCYVAHNGGDGIWFGSDGQIDGYCESADNGGTGLRVLSSGNRFVGFESDLNAAQGIYFDGRTTAGWTANYPYQIGNKIKPFTNNSGGFNFYVIACTGDCKSGASQPSNWDLAGGAPVTDNHVTWGNGGAQSSVSFNNSLVGGYVDDNCVNEIRMEGDSNQQTYGNVISGTWIAHAAASGCTANGIYSFFSVGNTISGVYMLGSAGQSDPASKDTGGIILQDSDYNVIGDVSAFSWHRTPILVGLNSTGNIFSGVSLLDTADATTSGTDAYGVFIDGSSPNNSFSNLKIQDVRGTTYSKGISNSSSGTRIDGYEWLTGVASPNSLGTATGHYIAPDGSLVSINANQFLWNVNGSPMLGVGAGGLTYQNIIGVNYLVSHYASIQAAINAAYNNGAVLGTVIDDRTAPYSGPGFILYDSVTLKLAATTYTITGTVSYNNGNNNVTAGIIAIPGARLIGAGTSTNHGTIITAGSGLNADLIATSTVGTGIGAAAQWWHWGELSNLRFIGNGANQTAGDCVKIENLGETARVRDIELSACKANNLEFIGASATQSAVANITSNQSVSGSGVAFTALAGVGVLNGISGDCNHVALISANFAASGTLEIHGLKAEAESSICPSQVQDPVILSSTTDSNALASVRLDGGYAFGTSQVNFLKSTGPGSIQFLMTNFYLTGYTNILNDTVRGQVIANGSTTTKQPVSYLSNGWVFGNQAFTFQPNTFMQANPNGTPTEMFGAGSDSSTDIAAIGNGDNTKYSAGGVKFGTFNRAQFGQTPEYQARMGWRWTNPGYDTTTWTFIPIWATGDTSARWIGDPNVRWPEVYAADVNSTTATVGTLNVTTCNGCGGSFQQVNSDWNAGSGVAQILNKPALATVATSGNYNDLSNKPSIPAQGVHVVSGTMQGPTSQITGTGSQIALYSATIPAGTFAVGTGMKCFARFHHSTGSAAVTVQWKLGNTTWNYSNTFTTGNSPGCQADIEILTPSALSSETVNVPIAAWGGNYQAPYTGLAWSENLANASTISLNFSVANTDKLTGDTFYCETMQ
jgi:hypothetical protein